MRSYISLFLVAALFSLSSYSAHAKLSMLPTIDVVEEISFNQDREKVLTFMKNDQIQKEMIKNGIDPNEALNRLASLSNSEIRKLSEQIENAQAGGDSGVGSILGVALLIFIILLVTDILGYTKVFPFTRSVN